MKVLVTGGLGNLGSWITRALVHNGHEVTTLSSRNRNVLTDLSFERIFASVSDRQELETVLDNRTFDAIIHLASVNEGNVPGYPRQALELNTWGTRCLLDWAAKQPVKPHFIYFSTFHAYGLSNGTISEDTALKPRHDYGTTHLFAEYYVQQAALSTGICTTTYRLTNSYGVPLEADSSKWYLVLNDLCKSAVFNNEIRLGSNGRPVRDFVAMADVCDVVLKCLDKGPSNDVFNLGGGKTYQMLDVAQTVRQAAQEVLGLDIPIKVNEADQTNYDQQLDVKISKLQSWIDYQPQDRMLDEAKAILKLALAMKNQ